MGDVLRVMLHVSPPTTLDDANEMVENVLVTCQRACRTAANHALHTLTSRLQCTCKKRERKKEKEGAEAAWVLLNRIWIYIRIWCLCWLACVRFFPSMV